MDRKDFLKKGLQGIGTIIALPTVLKSCSEDDDPQNENCPLSPEETAGPFPIKTPADLVRENIISDRTGVALLMTFVVQDQSNNCLPMAGVLVDVWHCDAGGNYSQYEGNTGEDFLRGRQTTDANGQASFISIFPGWYPGRAPHIHLEILNANGNSIRVTQVAFPRSACDTVYATSEYNGTADTQNEDDGILSDSLEGNMADSVTGNPTDGYTLVKTVIV